MPKITKKQVLQMLQNPKNHKLIELLQIFYQRLFAINQDRKDSISEITEQFITENLELKIFSIIARMLSGTDTCAAVSRDGKRLVVATNNREHTDDVYLPTLRARLNTLILFARSVTENKPAIGLALDSELGTMISAMIGTGPLKLIHKIKEKIDRRLEILEKTGITTLNIKQMEKLFNDLMSNSDFTREEKLELLQNKAKVVNFYQSKNQNKAEGRSQKILEEDFFKVKSFLWDVMKDFFTNREFFVYRNHIEIVEKWLDRLQVKIASQEIRTESVVTQKLSKILETVKIFCCDLLVLEWFVKNNPKSQLVEAIIGLNLNGGEGGERDLFLPSNLHQFPPYFQEYRIAEAKKERNQTQHTGPIIVDDNGDDIQKSVGSIGLVFGINTQVDPLIYNDTSDGDIHTEMKIFQYQFKHKKYAPIGISKLCCAFCHLFFDESARILDCSKLLYPGYHGTAHHLKFSQFMLNNKSLLEVLLGNEGVQIYSQMEGVIDVEGLQISTKEIAIFLIENMPSIISGNEEGYNFDFLNIQLPQHANMNFDVLPLLLYSEDDIKQELQKKLESLSALDTQGSRTEIVIPVGFDNVTGDGFCFYHAVVQHDPRYTAVELRNGAIQHILDNPTDYEGFITAEFNGNILGGLNHYLNQQLQQDHDINPWADQLMISAAAQFLGRRIEVQMFSIDGIRLEGDTGYGPNNDEPIVIANIGNIHFATQHSYVSNTPSSTNALLIEVPTSFLIHDVNNSDITNYEEEIAETTERIFTQEGIYNISSDELSTAISYALYFDIFLSDLTNNYY